VDWKPAHSAELLAKVRKDVLGPYPRNTRIYDHRHGARVVIYDATPGSRATAAPQSPRQ
jgi:hypothetical protein